MPGKRYRSICKDRIFFDMIMQSFQVIDIFIILCIFAVVLILAFLVKVY